MQTTVGNRASMVLPEPIVESLAAIEAGELRLEHLQSPIRQSKRLRYGLLHLSNSAYLSPRGGILNAASAARRIGLRTTVGLAIADATIDQFCDDGLTWYGHRPHGLLTHSLAVANTAWALSELVAQSHVAHGIVYVAGVFHDVGKLEVADRLGPPGPGATRTQSTDAPPDSVALTEYERLTAGFSHDQASAETAAYLGLGERVCTLIARSHDTDQSSIGSQILRLADSVVTAIGVGYATDIGSAPRFGDRDLDLGVRMLDSQELGKRCQRIALRESVRAVMIVQAIEAGFPSSEGAGPHLV